jgi:hypothetical protein
VLNGGDGADSVGGGASDDIQNGGLQEGVSASRRGAFVISKQSRR